MEREREREREKESGVMLSGGKIVRRITRKRNLTYLSNFCCCRVEYTTTTITTADIISTRTDKFVCRRPVFFKVH